MISNKHLPDIFTLLSANIKANGVVFAINSLVESGFEEYNSEFIKVQNIVSSGGTLSDGLESADLFDNKTIAIIRANEKAGKLDSAFKELASIAKFQRLSSRQIKQTLVMPIISFVLLIAVFMFLAEKLFVQLASSDKTGDYSLQLIGSMGEYIKDNHWLYPVVILSIVTIIIKAINSLTVVKWLASISIQLPFFGQVIKANQLGIWCRFAALMTSSGVSIVDAKKALSSVLTDKFNNAVNTLFDEVSSGKSWISATASNSWSEHDDRHSLPPLFMSYLSSGGVGGVWDSVLDDAADTFIEEYENSIESAKPAIHALSIIIVAIPLTFIVFKTFSSIYGV